MLIGLVFAVAAMALNSAAGLLESDATRGVGRGRSLVTRPRYLGGLVVDGLGWTSTVVALRFLPVFVVQAILGGAIVLIAVGARIVYGSALRGVDWLACAGCVVGLALVAASAGPNRSTDASSAAVALGVAAIALVVALVVAWRAGVAWTLALVAGMGFGGSSVAVRAVHLTAETGFVGLLGAPVLYLVIVFGAVGLAAYSRALERAGVARVTAVLLVTEVVVPGLAGMVLLGDSVRPGGWPAMVVGLMLAVVGVVVLADSPATSPPPRRT